MLSRIMVDLDFFVGSLWQIGGKGVCVEAEGFVALMRGSCSVRRCVYLRMPLSSHLGHVSDGVCSFGSTLEQAKDGWNSVTATEAIDLDEIWARL